MAKLIFIKFLLILFFSFLSVATASAKDKTSTVKVGIFQLAPLVYVNEKGSPEGIFVDIIEKIAAAEGLKIEYVYGTWNEGLDSVAKGRIDLMTAVMHLPRRESFLEFSKEAVFNTWGQIYTHKDSKILNIFNIEGKTVGVLKGGANGENFIDLLSRFGIQGKVVEFNSQGEIALAINDKKVDAGVFNNIHGYKYQHVHQLRQTQIVFDPSYLKFAALVGSNRQLLSTIDRYLLKWKSNQNSPYSKIIEKHLGIPQHKNIPDWAWNLFIAGISIIGVSILSVSFLVFFNKRLKTEVKSSTQNLSMELDKRKKAESEAKKSRSLLEAALESTADGILVVDKKGLWAGYNQKFVDIWGIPVSILDSADDKKALDHIITQLKDPEKFITKVRHLYKNEDRISLDTIELKNGKILERYTQPQKIKDHITGRVWSFRDITDQVLSQKKIEESEEYHKGLFENSPTALCIQDFSKVDEQIQDLLRKGINDIRGYLKADKKVVKQLVHSLKIVRANNAAVKLYGARDSDDLSLKFSNLIIPDDSGHFIDQVVAFSEANDWYEGEARNFSLKGNTLAVILKKVVINREKNGLSKVLVSVVDLTALSQADLEKKQLEKQLRQAQKMETIGTLAGGIAHDFNNILFPITGYAELLLSDVPEDSPLRDSINEIYSGAMRATDLVKQILTFSRQESSEPKIIKVQNVAKEVLRLIRSMIPATIEIFQNIDKACGPIKADPTQIHQVIMNLLTNSYHAMEETGGVLNISIKEVEFGEFDSIPPGIKTGRYAALIVRDNGAGMTKDIIGNIFDPFFTTKEKGKGTGMGLSVVHGIVTKMGGVINVYSEPGNGTEFKLYFPIETGTQKFKNRQAVSEITGGNEHILLVDDEKSIISLEKQTLERLGYKVTSRTSSLEAFEAFRANPEKYDLVISDVAMPKMRGDQLASRMISIRPDIPILLCTGFSETVTVERASNLGVKGFLMKPLIMKDLAHSIRNIFDKSHP